MSELVDLYRPHRDPISLSSTPGFGGSGPRVTRK